MVYELGGVKKRPWWELLLESFGAGGVGFGGGGDLRTSLLGESPAAGPVVSPAVAAPAAVAPAAKTSGLFTEGGVTYGEESRGLPPEERVALDPEEIARRREAFKPERTEYATKRRETLLGELGAEGYRRRILGAPPKMDVSWRQR